MKKLLLTLPFIALLLMSCSKDSENRLPAVSINDDQVVFTTRAATRADVVATENLTSFNVVAVSVAPQTSDEVKVWDDGVFTGTPQGDFTGGKYWPTNTVSWNFYAAANATMTFAPAGTTVAVENCEKDVVAKYLQGAGYKQKNVITFEHILCQLGTVALKAPEGYAVTDAKMYLNPIYSGTYSIKAVNGANDAAKRAGWTRGSASTTPVYIVGNANTGVQVSTETNNSTYTSGDNDLWLVPGEYTLTLSYTISKGDYRAENVTKTCTVTLQQGLNNNLGLAGTNQDQPNIPVPDDISDVVFTVTVTPWDDVNISTNFE